MGPENWGRRELDEARCWMCCFGRRLQSGPQKPQRRVCCRVWCHLWDFRDVLKGCRGRFLAHPLDEVLEAGDQTEWATARALGPTLGRGSRPGSDKLQKHLRRVSCWRSLRMVHQALRMPSLARRPCYAGVLSVRCDRCAMHYPPNGVVELYDEQAQAMESAMG